MSSFVFLVDLRLSCTIGIAHSPSIIIALPLHLANVKLILLGTLQGNPFPSLSPATCHPKVLGAFGFQQNFARTMAF